ncbi:MAG: M24 family metallopeptidase [Rhodobacteraceae bacterium]|jgi:Xaa-Pro aminopeptidase|nr:M24 family metallopeptidase [Paracoccaceae bacterium]
MTTQREIAARTTRLRAAMAEAGLAAMVIAGNTEFQQKGYIRYYADWRLFGGTAYMVVPATGDPVLVMGLGAQAEWAGELAAVRDTRAVLDKIGGVVAALRDGTRPGDGIGVVGLDTIMPHGDAKRLIADLAPLPVTDATDLVERLWCVLTPADTARTQTAHARVARIFDAFRDALRPDRTEREVVAEAIAVAVRAGCLEGVIHLNHDTRGGTRPATDRVIGRDDIIKMFMEFLTPEGYLIELGGCFSFRPPPAPWQRKFDLVAGAIAEAVSATRPGMVADDLVRGIRATYDRAGAVVVGRRLWDFHGQGMHSLLRPFGLPGSVDPIADAMMINIHPGLLTDDGLGISATSNYIVTPSGGAPLGAFAHRWHVVG